MNNPQPMGGATRIARSAALLVSLSSLGMLLTIGWQLSLAYLFGASGDLDAFWIGSAIPKAIADTVHLGILTLVFIAIFGQEEGGVESQHAWRVASSVFNVVLVATAIIAVLLVVAAPVIIRGIGPGLEPGAQALAVKLLRMLTPILIPTALVGACAGIFNAHQRFFPFALSRVVAVAIQIAVLFLLVQRLGIQAPVVALLLGALTMLGICLSVFRRSGFRHLRVIAFEGDRPKAILRLFLALVAFTVLGQLNQMSDRLFASFLASGSISILEFAWRFESPITQVLGFSVALPAFATMALQASEERRDEFRETLIVSVRLVALLVVPAIGFLVVLREPLVVLWFERGAFAPAASAMVFSLIPLLGFIFLMKAFASVMVFSLLSLNIYKPLVGILCLEVLANTVMNHFLVRYLELPGIVLATALAMAASNAWLWTLLVRRAGGWSLSSFATRAWRTAAVSLFAIGALQAFHVTFALYRPSAETFSLILEIGASALVFAITYLGLCVLFGLIDLRFEGRKPTLRLSAREWSSSRAEGS